MNPCFHLNHIREREVGKSYVGCLIDCRATPGVGGTPYNGQYGEAPPERSRDFVG